MRIAIIGAGNVGGLAAMRIVEESIADVVLVDIAKGLAQAKASDLDDARSMTARTTTIEGTTDFSRIADSDIVVMTAGLARKPGMTREDLLKTNYAIVKDVAGSIKCYAPGAIVIVVSNPLDVMTYVMLKETGFDKARVFGIGINLDSARFNNLVAAKTKVSIEKIKTLVIGSHGQTMIPLARLSMVNKKPLTEILSSQEVAELAERTKNRGAEIVSLYGTGSAYFAPGAAILELCCIIAGKKDQEIVVSAYLNGEYGASDVCIGVPVVLSQSGIKKIIELKLKPEEEQLFGESVKSLKENIRILYPKE